MRCSDQCCAVECVVLTACGTAVQGRHPWGRLRITAHRWSAQQAPATQPASKSETVSDVCWIAICMRRWGRDNGGGAGAWAHVVLIPSLTLRPQGPSPLVCSDSTVLESPCRPVAKGVARLGRWVLPADGRGVQGWYSWRGRAAVTITARHATPCQVAMRAHMIAHGLHGTPGRQQRRRTHARPQHGVASRRQGQQPAGHTTQPGEPQHQSGAEAPHPLTSSASSSSASAFLPRDAG